MDREQDPNVFGPGPYLVMGTAGTISGVLTLVALLAVASPTGWKGGLAERTFLFAPGAIYGIAVMIPFRRVVATWWLRMIAAATICSFAHYVALHLAEVIRPWELTPANFALMRSLGAFIAGKGLLVIIGRPWRYRTLAAMIAAGELVGPAFLSMIFLAYIPWQVLTAAPLGALLAEARASNRRS